MAHACICGRDGNLSSAINVTVTRLALLKVAFGLNQFLLGNYVTSKMVRLLWLLIIFVTMGTTASQQCKDAAYSMRGKYLKGHVISSGIAADIGDCLVKCSNESRCKSINFRFKGRFCKINAADRFTHPWDYGSGSMSYAYSDYPVKVRSVFSLVVIIKLVHCKCLNLKYSRGPLLKGLENFSGSKRL